MYSCPEKPPPPRELTRCSFGITEGQRECAYNFKIKRSKIYPRGADPGAYQYPNALCLSSGVRYSSCSIIIPYSAGSRGLYHPPRSCSPSVHCLRRAQCTAGPMAMGPRHSASVALFGARVCVAFEVCRQLPAIAALPTLPRWSINAACAPTGATMATG